MPLLPSPSRSLLLPALGLLAACGFEENLPEIDIEGTIIVPREAATRTVYNEEGDEVEVTDVRFIGPVYVGAFASVQEGLFDYPHPEMGPVIDEDYPGDTYPYGGTSVGRFDFACFEDTACKVVTGRFGTFEEIIEYFADYVRDPVTNPYGDEVTSADYYEQYCYDYYYYTSVEEFDFLSRDDDGEVDLDFEENADGDFEATFSMPHTVYTEGMQIWGWVDNASETWTFSTCDPDRTGPTSYEYNLDFDAGGGQRDVLNYPSLYISDGDWVISSPHTMSSEDDEPSLVVDYEYDE